MVKRVALEPCKNCGQKVDEPPGFYLATDGPEAIMDADITLVHPDIVKCGTCHKVVWIGSNGSVRVRKATEADR